MGSVSYAIFLGGLAPVLDQLCWVNGGRCFINHLVSDEKIQRPLLTQRKSCAGPMVKKYSS